MNTVSNNISIVKTEETAKRLSEMLEGCFRRTESSSLKISNQRYESIHKEVDTDFYAFVKVRLSADEELRTKKSEFSVAEVIVKVVCENINSGELDICYNIWKPFRDEKLWAYDGHFTHLRDLEVNIRNDMLVYFWDEYTSSKCLGHKYNLWWVITVREDDGYLIFKDVFPPDLRMKVSSFSMKHIVKPSKPNKNVREIVKKFAHNKGERIMKEYGNKGAFGMNMPAPSNYGWDDTEWSVVPLIDGKLHITKTLHNDGSKSFIISVEDDGDTLNIIKHEFTTVKTVSEYLKKEETGVSKDKQDDLENKKLQRPFFTPKNPKVHSVPNTHISLKDMSNPFHFKGLISHEDELRMEGNMVCDLYTIQPIDPESKKFFHYEEGVTVISVIWTGLTWALYGGPSTPEKFKGFIDNINSLKYETGDKEDTILAYNHISKKYERYEHDGSGWVQWGLTSGSMKYSVLPATMVSNHFQLPDGRFLTKNTIYIIHNGTPLYQNRYVCLVNQRKDGWINQEVIDRSTLSANHSSQPTYVGLVYGNSIDSLDQFNKKYCRITGDIISVKTKQNVWMDFVWTGGHWYEIPTNNVPNIQFKGIIGGLHEIPETEARRGDVYFCIKEKQLYIHINGDWKPYFD